MYTETASSHSSCAFSFINLSSSLFHFFFYQEVLHYYAWHFYYLALWQLFYLGWSTTLKNDIHVWVWTIWEWDFFTKCFLKKNNNDIYITISSKGTGFFFNVSLKNRIFSWYMEWHFTPIKWSCDSTRAYTWCNYWQPMTLSDLDTRTM